MKLIKKEDIIKNWLDSNIKHSPIYTRYKHETLNRHIHYRKFLTLDDNQEMINARISVLFNLSWSFIKDVERKKIMIRLKKKNLFLNTRNQGF